MSESKLSKTMIAGLRDSDPALLAHFLTQNPDAQANLFALVENLLQVWTNNHNSGMFYGEVDRQVQAKAANVQIAPARTPRAKKTKAALPPDNVWDGPNEHPSR